MLPGQREKHGAGMEAGYWSQEVGRRSQDIGGRRLDGKPIKERWVDRVI